MNGQRITIELESLPHAVPVTIRLRRLLKMMLRSFGFRAVVKELPPDSQATVNPVGPSCDPSAQDSPRRRQTAAGVFNQGSTMTSIKPKKRRRRLSKAKAKKLYSSISERSTARVMEASRIIRDIAPAPTWLIAAGGTPRLGACWLSSKLISVTHSRNPGVMTIEKPLPGWRRRSPAAVNLRWRCPAGRERPRPSKGRRWAVLTGRRRFVVIAAANESLAEQSLGRLKAELEHNDLLLADFPKAVYPIRKLESQARRCVGQLFGGQRTSIVWQRKRLVLPTMPDPDNESTGAVLHVAGLTGAVRGLSHVDAEGRTIRPDLLLVDDPQDRESARSVIQTAERLALLNGDLLGLAGPGQKIAALATVTVIHRRDLADQLLDRERNPAWQGERFKLVYSFPSNTERWEEYAKLRNQSLRRW